MNSKGLQLERSELLLIVELTVAYHGCHISFAVRINRDMLDLVLMAADYVIASGVNSKPIAMRFSIL